MRECANCMWIGDWEEYSDAGYDGYLCSVCAWTKLSRTQWMSQAEQDIAKSVALIANVLCTVLHVDFDLVVKANQLLLPEE